MSVKHNDFDHWSRGLIEVALFCPVSMDFHVSLQRGYACLKAVIGEKSQCKKANDIWILHTEPTDYLLCIIITGSVISVEGIGTSGVIVLFCL